MPELLTDPPVLRERLRDLAAGQRSGSLNGDGGEALVECCFRLAVHPATPVGEALELLQRALRADGANPRYPYHIARLCFLHGDLDRAGRWLSRAHQLCPTSHRIWAHLSLLQKELDARYRSDDRYEPKALRSRGASLAEKVLGGEDSVEEALFDLKPSWARAHLEALARQGKRPPGEAPGNGNGDLRPEGPRARRLMDAGRCRWSGMRDLLAEELLEGSPSDDTHRKLKPLLDEIVRDGEERPGGAAGWAILAIEWLLNGYPAATVRRLLGTLRPETRSPSLKLLDLTCTLYEEDEERLPALLSEALDAGRIPPLLAALVHHRRLLWHPLRLRSLPVVYRSARRFLQAAEGKEGEDKAAAEHVKALTRAGTELEARRPSPIEEIPEEEAPLGSRERLQALDEEAQQVKARLEESWGRLKDLVAASAGGALTPDQAAEAAGIGELVQRTKDLSAQGLDELASLRAAGEVDSEEALKHLERVETALRGLTQQEGRFRKNLAKLSLPGPSKEKAAESEAGGETPQGPVQESLTPLELLEQALRQVDQKVAALFARAHATFDAYSPRARSLPPILALRLSLRAREAEARYRLGQRREARALWVRLLSEDRLSLAAAKNIAICDTTGPELGRELAAWRSYLELLYFYDVVAGDPGRQARAREECHGQLGNAFAPAPPLWKDTKEKDKHEDEGEVDDLAFAGFLNNPGRVRVFVNHKLLEILNASLNFTSPTLLLGVARDEGAEARAAAREKMLAFLEAVSPLLPDRVREAFTDLARRRIQSAFEACQSARRLVRKQDPLYAEEESRLLQRLEKVLQLKLNLFRLIAGGEEPVRPELAAHLTSPAFVEELCRLDRIPLENSRRLLAGAAAALRLSPSLPLATFMGVLKKQVISAFIAKKRLDKVLPLLLNEIEADDRQPNLPVILVRSFLEMAEETESIEGHEQVSAAVARWIGRARERLRSNPRPDEELDAAAVDKVEEGYEQFLIRMALYPVGGIQGEKTDWKKIAEALDELLARHPGLGHAWAYAMHAWYSLAGRAQEAKDQARLIHCLQKTRDLARKVLEHSRDEQERETAWRRIEEVDQLLAPIEGSGRS